MLVIDDEDDFRAFARTVIEGLGFRVLEAACAEEGLAQAGDANPAAILLDLSMPGSDGVEVLRALAKNGCRSTVVLTSGHDSRVLHTAVQVGREHGLAMGGQVEKPIDLDLFEEILCRAATPSGPAEPNAAALQQAISRGELELHYQPKVALRDTTGTPEVEALVRWPHPELGLLTPNRFLPLAETSGQMTELTTAVLDLAFAQVARWQQDGLALKVSVNIPPELLTDLELPERITARAAEHGVDPGCLVLEAVETTAFKDDRVAMDALARLRLRGVGLAIDDFGTGHSSLLLLYRMPFSELKIDRSFVCRIEDDEEARVIVRTSIDLAHHLGMTACIEGVETAETLAWVRECGADSVQGFYFSRPLPADEIAAFYRERVAEEKLDAPQNGH
ncbi:MAG: EAL domain-containing response regulator [Gammaproteobacteria bacterium]|nr:EAL domain-containing response regulator [Gammaproteobacteria bacterium]